MKSKPSELPSWRVRQPVTSSAIRDVGYDEGRCRLAITFTTGRAYEYLGVQPSVHDALMAAPSAGTFFNQHIRDQYPFREITGIAG